MKNVGKIKEAAALWGNEMINTSLNIDEDNYTLEDEGVANELFRYSVKYRCGDGR